MLHKSISKIREQIVSDIRSSVPAGTFNLSIDQTSAILGITAGFIRNQISNGQFQIETVLIGSRRLIPLTTIADYLVEQIVSQNQVKLGRPTKLSKQVQARLVAEGGAK